MYCSIFVGVWFFFLCVCVCGGASLSVCEIKGESVSVYLICVGGIIERGCVCESGGRLCRCMRESVNVCECAVGKKRGEKSAICFFVCVCDSLEIPNACWSLINMIMNV